MIAAALPAEDEATRHAAPHDRFMENGRVRSGTARHGTARPLSSSTARLA